ncbi:aminoglycoside phosphotransferase family protein [Deinococcus maricopensis]|uniref:aminoglycoside phosphotransferase family protein n=1 Tax=Deinococcus maricopensis TaxID=309887 RepID=UPI0002F029E3|nr:aminoglycoside phosphotransferase family protein [Deinococcus maricopensis]
MSASAPAVQARGAWRSLTFAVTRRGPVQSARAWPRDVSALFPARRLVEAWRGDGANFARYTSARGPLFLKYRSPMDRDARAQRRLANEVAYLRALAPACPVPSAPLLHAQLDDAARLGHVLMEDLTERTVGWGAVPTGEREARLVGIVRAVADFHAHWLARPDAWAAWRWRAERERTRLMEGLAVPPPGATVDVLDAGPPVCAALKRLDLSALPVTLIHGDLHAGQFLLDPHDTGVVTLIDFGRVRAAPPGVDLAHLLAVRLTPEDRAALAPTLQRAYAARLAEHGVTLDGAAQWRAGVLMNAASVWREAQRTPSEGVREALRNVLDAARAVW